MRLFRVFGGDTDYLYEICYTLVLSVSGEALDLLGFHRVHALGLSVTVGRNEAAGIVVLPSGGGKSAMAALLLDKEPRLRVFSDETPLLRRGRIYPFPTRIALRPEVLRALIPQANGRLFRRKRYPEKILLDILPQQVARSAPLSFVMVGVPGYPRAEIRKGRSSTSFRALAETMVVGLGVAQMAEHMLRLQAVPGLAEIAFSRLVEAIRVCRCCEHYLFLMSENARENSRALREFLVKRD